MKTKEEENKELIPFYLPELEAYEQEIKEKYTYIKQDSAINALARISSKSGIEKIDFTNTGVIKTTNGQTDLKAIIEEYSKVKLKQSTSKLLRLIEMKFTEKGSRDKKIFIPLKEYMELMGLKNEKEARKKVKADLEALHNTKCTATYNKKNGEYVNFEIIAERGIVNGIIFANLYDTIFYHLQNCKVMPYPKTLLKIESNSNKNPYAFYLGDKIVELMKYHRFEPSFIVSVKTLLEECTRNGMPSYEDVKAGSRHVDKLIIEPFFRDLDACSHNIFEYEPCNIYGIPLREDQLDIKTYQEFISLYIKIIPLNDYPRGEYDKKKIKKKIKKKNKKST